MVVEYHKVLAAATGGDGETASFVRGDFTSQFDCLDKRFLESDWGRMLSWVDKRGCGNVRFGRAYVLPVFFEVPFYSCEQLGEVFTYQLQG